MLEVEHSWLFSNRTDLNLLWTDMLLLKLGAALGSCVCGCSPFADVAVVWISACFSMNYQHARVVQPDSLQVRTWLGVQGSYCTRPRNKTSHTDNQLLLWLFLCTRYGSTKLSPFLRMSVRFPIAVKSSLLFHQQVLPGSYVAVATSGRWQAIASIATH